MTFIEVLRDRPPGHDWELEPGVTCGDYLFGMLQVRLNNSGQFNFLILHDVIFILVVITISFLMVLKVMISTGNKVSFVCQ